MTITVFSFPFFLLLFCFGRGGSAFSLAPPIAHANSQCDISNENKTVVTLITRISDLDSKNIADRGRPIDQSETTNYRIIDMAYLKDLFGRAHHVIKKLSISTTETCGFAFKLLVECENCLELNLCIHT